MLIFISIFLLSIFLLALRKILKANDQINCLLENTPYGYLFLNHKLKIYKINQRAYQILGIEDDLKQKQLSLLHNHKWGPSILSVVEQTQKTKKSSHQLFPLSTEHENKLEILAKPTLGKDIILKICEITSEETHITMGKNFIASASHELRTPITIIKGFAETLKDMPNLSSSMFDTMISKIISSSERMELLIKNLLILADLDNSSKLQKNPTDLVSLVNSVSETMVNLHPSIHIEHLHNKDSICLHANEALIELALVNLLQNAIKYSPQHHQIKVTTTALEDHIKIAIKDLGIGIPSEKLHQIFEKFHTVNKSHSRKLGGAGLGLSIVKTIASKHSATISVESEIDQGSTFTLCFPNII